MSDKVCHQCGGTFPAEQFGRTEGGNLTKWCNACRQERQADRAIKRQEKTLDDIEKAALQVFTRGASIGGENVPHVSELLERVMMLFGGSNGFASAIVKQYFDAPVGSATRTKLLETITKLTVNVSEQGASKKPLELWTDEELEAELDKRLEGIASSFRVIEAAPESIAATDDEPEHHELPEAAVEGASGRDLPEVDRGDQDVSADSDTGRDAQVPSE